ncbi:hypothetical protein FMO001_27410 [Moritella sp. F1]|nr:hypothetical protein FMO001_27410 [Moritella sp. F1]
MLNETETFSFVEPFYCTHDFRHNRILFVIISGKCRVLLEVLLLTYDQTGRGTKNFEMEFIHKTNLKAAANYIDFQFSVNKVISNKSR